MTIPARIKRTPRAGDPGKYVQSWLTTPLWKAAVDVASERGQSLRAFVFDAILDAVDRHRTGKDAT